MTVEASIPPIPLRERFSGLADTNCNEPATGAATTMVADDDAMPDAVAVTVSLPAQPLSLYDAVATPLTVVVDAVMVALPLATHDDVKDTLCGAVTATPPLVTVTLTLVVP